MKPRDEETRERERESNRRKAEKRWEKPRPGVEDITRVEKDDTPCRREIIPRFFFN